MDISWGTRHLGYSMTKGGIHALRRSLATNLVGRDLGENAPAYVFLTSPHCSSFIAGEILPIIGGYAGG
jgi:hypothetical protein